MKASIKHALKLLDRHVTDVEIITENEALVTVPDPGALIPMLERAELTLGHPIQCLAAEGEAKCRLIVLPESL